MVVASSELGRGDLIALMRIGGLYDIYMLGIVNCGIFIIGIAFND